MCSEIQGLLCIDWWLHVVFYLCNKTRSKTELATGKAAKSWNHLATFHSSELLDLKIPSTPKVI